MAEEKEKLPKETTENKNPLTYGQLTEVCNNLYQQNKELIQELQQARSIISSFNRLDYLFKVLDHSDVIKDPDFINDVIDEIRDAIIIKEAAQEKK